MARQFHGARGLQLARQDMSLAFSMGCMRRQIGSYETRDADTTASKTFVLKLEFVGVWLSSRSVELHLTGENSVEIEILR
jgi:hypothetical protein